MNKSDIKKGIVLPIYKDWRHEEGLMGYAKLIEKVSKIEEELPYVYEEVGSGDKKEPHCYIYSFERWKITYVDPYEYDSNMSFKKRMKYIHQKGFTTHWNISYFVTIDSTYPSNPSNLSDTDF